MLLYQEKDFKFDIIYCIVLLVDKRGVLMKIKYDLDNVNYKFHDFIQGVHLFKNGIKKGKVRKLHGFTFYMGCLFMCKYSNTFAFQMFTGIFTVLIFLIVFSYLSFFIAFLYNRRRLSDGYIKLTNDGLTDDSDNLSVTVKWDKIDFIAIKENMIVVMPENEFFMMTFKTDDIGKFIKNVKKYNKKLLIIKFD